MSDRNRSFEWHDIAAAFALLTRIPVRVDFDRLNTRGGRAAWAYPLVGLVIGVDAGLLGWLLQWIGLPQGMVAAFVILLTILLTGGLHEDGLADCADGMGGGATVERRLEIMKDSRIGAYGALALMLAILSRWSGISTLYGLDLVLTLAAIGAGSRACMVAIMFVLDPARKTGLSVATGQPDSTAFFAALGLGLMACVVLTGLSGIVLFGVMLIASIPLAYAAQRLLRGQTGDVLGGTQQIAEIAGLAAAIVLL